MMFIHASIKNLFLSQSALRLEFMMRLFGLYALNVFIFCVFEKYVTLFFFISRSNVDVICFSYRVCVCARHFLNLISSIVYYPSREYVLMGVNKSERERVDSEKFLSNLYVE